MNTALLLARSPEREQHIITTTTTTLAYSHTGITLADRITHRLGLWLLLQSTRHIPDGTDYAIHHHRRVALEARESRERAYQRAYLLQSGRV